MRSVKTTDPTQYGPLARMPYTRLFMMALIRILYVTAFSHMAWVYSWPS